MTVTLTPADHAWLTRQVAAGRFPSLDAALSAAIAELKAHDSAPDLAWAKPLVDASSAAIERGVVDRVLSLPEIGPYLNSMEARPAGDGRSEEPHPASQAQGGSTWSE